MRLAIKTNILSSDTKMPVSQAGFSLVELLVVLFVVALLVGIVVVQVTAVREENENLTDQIDHFIRMAYFASDQAVLTGLPYGVVIEPPNLDHAWRFRWLRYERGQWDKADSVLAAQNYPEDIDLAAEIEGSPVDFETVEEAKEKDILPSIIFHPGGEVTPFTMTFYSDHSLDESIMLTSEVTGVVELVDEDKFELLFDR